ncbi:CLAVATA3/ESR (CLE)-related protein 46-like [Chenopodium quinoa]|uniref:CLAVATA3/ESR (CLE)-related protein 46-like n=1 Tax=Chenopodium quinoa TaxID=63459 RepID=UPI000B777650|nr:CLAVATA3/ESR (CLE)-related protein 46-like [Chenopodium quinoa]
MARRHILILLLLAWFLFAAFQSNRPFIKDQATKSVNFKLRSLQSSSLWPTKHHIPAWDDLKKIHKSPSGPNPVGNHRPPTRP